MPIRERRGALLTLPLLPPDPPADGADVWVVPMLQVTLAVEQVAPTMKGETAAPSYKPAVLAGGLKVKVPPFVQQGEQVVVDTSTGEFVRRA